MKRQTIAVGAIGIAVVLAAWYLLLWAPKGHELDKARDRKEAAEVAASEADLKLSRLKATERRKDELLAQKAAYTAAVPETSDVPGIILAINDAAFQAGVTFLAITPTAPVPGLVAGQPSNVALAISVTGSYGSAMDFLSRVAGLDRLITVDTMTLTPEVDGLTVSAVSVSITARAFTTEASGAGAAASTGAAAAAPSAPAAPAPAAAALTPTGSTASAAAAPGAPR